MLSLTTLNPKSSIYFSVPYWRIIQPMI